MNAFALPGGYVFVNTGLIKLASDEDELAGALAHEIAHVAARHMTCRASKAQVASGATLIPGVFLGGWSGLAAHVAASAAIPMTFLSFSRHDESEADFLGVQYMYAAGYDPTGAVSILEKLEAMQKTKPGVVAKVFATHPMSSDRIAKTEAEIQRILPPREEYVVTTSEYQAVRERLLDQEIRRKAAEMRGKPGEGKVDDEHPTLKRYDLKEQRHTS
jgi:predicted Zn-dependent protease